MLTGTILIAAALTLIVLGNRLVRNDEILGLAAYISSIVMAVGGVVCSPQHHLDLPGSAGLGLATTQNAKSLTSAARHEFAPPKKQAPPHGCGGRLQKV